MNKYLDWWSRKTTASLGFLLFTHLIQIPHFVWAGDAYLQTGYISHLHPVFDFILYGADLLEIPAIIVVVSAFIARLKR